MKISKEIKAAIIVISGIVLFILGINFLMSNSIFSNATVYHSIFNHSGGLQPSTPVTVNGLKIGQVKDVSIRQSDAKIVVTYEINSDFKFSKNSRAELFSSLLGNTGLQIIPALDGATPAPSGAEIKSSVQPGMIESITNQLDPLKKKLTTALDSADSLLLSVNSILDNQRKEKLRNTINNLEDITANFKDASADLKEILASNKGRLNNSLDSIESMTANFAKLSDDIANSKIDSSLLKFNSAMVKLDNVMAGIENGDGSIGKLLKDEKLYENLEGASKELEQLLEDLKLNPKRYVHFSLFGKKNKEYKTPEDEKQ